MRISSRCLLIFIIIIFASSIAFAMDYDYSENDVILLAQLIDAEGRGEEFDGQIAIGNVVINRLKNGYWGDSIGDVIYAKGQFASSSKSYTDECYDAAIVALSGEYVVPEHILYFQRAKVKYFYGDWYCTIGNHNFYGNMTE